MDVIHKKLKNTTSPSVVCIGGGTGLSTMLRGLKKTFSDITAIVTVADDGGGSGVLREELGMLPPGDIRNCLLALSNIEPTMYQLLNYRFESGHLSGQSFGNLFLAAMNGISGSFDVAVTRMSEVLAITGRVLPVTNEDIQLMAEFDDGSTVIGESKINHAKMDRDCAIKNVSLIPQRPKALPESIEAIDRADLIILGPGSLYTSIIPNLLVDGIADAIIRADAMKLYVSNIMTQNGETEGMAVSDHIRALFRHSADKIFDICLANNAAAPRELLAKYAKEDANQLFIDRAEVERMGIKVYEAAIMSCRDDRVRHDPPALTEQILQIYRNLSQTKKYMPK